MTTRPQFRIRVQRETYIFGRPPRPLNTPFVKRGWDIEELGEDGEYFYRGFAWTADQAVKSIADIVRERSRREAGRAEFAASIAQNDEIVGFIDGEKRIHFFDEDMPLQDGGSS